MISVFNHRIYLAFACVAFGFSYSTKGQEAYPSRTIKIVAPVQAGGANDIVARALASHLAAAWRANVIVENKPGAAQAIGATTVARSAPDGYTFLLAGPSLSTISVYSKNPDFDPVKDFVPISTIATFPYIVAVSTASGLETIKDLIAFAKANPGKLAYGAFGGGQRLAIEDLSRTAEINMLRVPYQGEAPALFDLSTNEIQFTVASLLTVRPLAATGKIRAIAVMTDRRVTLAPELPTIAESGLPGFNVEGWFGIVAPANTPALIRDKMALEVAKFVSQPDNQKRLATIGFVARSSTSKEFDDLVRSEVQRWREVARYAGIVTCSPFSRQL